MSDVDPDRYKGHDRETWMALVDRRNDMLAAHRSETIAYTHRLSAWMIGQLFLANAGGLTIHATDASPLSLTFFLAGLLCSMSCSLAAWWQSHLVYHHVFDLSNPNAILGANHLPSEDKARSRRENFWFGAAILSGIASLTAFAAGAVLRIWS